MSIVTYCVLYQIGNVLLREEFKSMGNCNYLVDERKNECMRSEEGFSIMKSKKIV
jgi:hypothetical protein